MNIVVLCGGISTEREISISTGTMVCRALRESGHRAILMDVYCGCPDLDMTNPFSDNYDIDAEIAKINHNSHKLKEIKAQKKSSHAGFFGENVLRACKESDIVFMALHGEQGENGSVQAAFDLHDIKYTGTGPLGSSMAMNKGVTKEICIANGIPSPKGVRVSKNECTDLKALGLSLPCVVKPCCGGSSVGVSIARTVEEYNEGLSEAFQYENEIVIEEFIQGREFSVGVIAGKALPIIEIVPKEGFYDYKNKYIPGMTEDICPARLDAAQTKEMQTYAEKTAKALRLGSYCRIDFLLQPDGRMFCLEANTLPGMTPTSLLPQEALVAGYSFPELCDLLIKESMKNFD